MLLVYKGPSPSVMIGLGDLGYVTAVHGEPFEVPDEKGKSLLEQDIFESAKKAKAVPNNAAEPQEKE